MTGLPGTGSGSAVFEAVQGMDGIWRKEGCRALTGKGIVVEMSPSRADDEWETKRQNHKKEAWNVPSGGKQVLGVCLHIRGCPAVATQ